MSRTEGSAGFLTGLLVGAAAGSALTLLYTPRRARRVRELLQSRGSDVGAATHGPRERLLRLGPGVRRWAARVRPDLLDGAPPEHGADAAR